MQTQVHLGLLHFREQEGDEEPEPNLPLARHSIDMLGMLQEKTKGNLNQEEQRLIENGLTELRFRYIQVFEAQKKKNEPKPAEEEPRIIVSDGGKGSKTE